MLCPIVVLRNSYSNFLDTKWTQELTRTWSLDILTSIMCWSHNLICISSSVSVKFHTPLSLYHVTKAVQESKTEILLLHFQHLWKLRGSNRPQSMPACSSIVNLLTSELKFLLNQFLKSEVPCLEHFPLSPSFWKGKKPASGFTSQPARAPFAPPACRGKEQLRAKITDFCTWLSSHN